MDRLPFPTTVHPYPSLIPNSCAYESGPSGAENAILFVGGLGDGPHTVSYTYTIAQHLEGNPHLNYSLFEIRMRSSFGGFGNSNLKNDVQDISALVKYLRGIGRKKIVLMGHSTGSQDCVEYSLEKENPVDGFILQGAVSDRQGVAPLVEPEFMEESLAVAAKMVSEGKQDDCMPRNLVPSFYNTPITAYRWNSLVGKGGDDDYFSSDLDAEFVSKVWSRFEKPALVLLSGEDEYVPAEIDTEALLKSWMSASSRISSLSGLIPGANHTVNDPKAQKWMVERIVRFIQDL